jgi:serine protease Do
MPTKRTIATALPLLLILASQAHAEDRSATATAMSAPAMTDPDLAFARNLSRAFRRVASDVQPSVVSIRTVDQAPVQPVRGGAPLFRFGPRLVVPRAEQPMPQRQGLGTGFILKEDGAIVTNLHVVRDASQIMVRLADGRELPAELVGGDPESDVAVLRVEADGLAAARLVDSSQVEVGDWVLALGSPFGLDQTVTAGIISAKGRDGVGLAVFENYLQTDAAINPGNSGGPLVTLDGTVVGMNTAIGSRSGGNDGVGFAIPMEWVRRVAEQILQDGRASHGYLGVLLEPEVPGTVSEGVRLVRVVPGGPAAQAGLQEGDLVVRVGETPVRGRAALMRTIGSVEPGATVTVNVLREGEPLQVEVTVAARPMARVAIRDGRGGVLVPGR